MSTTVPTRTCENSPAALLTVDALLAEPGTEIVEAPSHYPNFDGVVLRRSSGPLQIVLPKGSADREAAARRLVAQIVGAHQLPLQSGTFGGAR
ncbi:hypothetical protein ACH4A8_38865 [Streptomyces vietnamensis]|uniref:hypothetical protein n=1 Tax=Streptomyces vietnamensis TaxID=362257 RepID=UPI00379FA0AE